MSEQVIAREMQDGIWQWYIHAAQNDANGEPTSAVVYTGDSEALKASLPAANTPIGLVLRGQQIISTSVRLDAKQARHAAKLIPYELEDELSGSVDELHFAYREVSEDGYAVIYTDRNHCAEPIGELSEQGCDVYAALPDYLMLYRPEHGISLLLEENIVSARLSEHWGFAVELELAGIILQRLADHSALNSDPPQRLCLTAESEQALVDLAEVLPESWRAIERESAVGGFWDCLDTHLDKQNAAAGLNLRSGQFARQLPIARWWNIWKRPVYFLVAAFVLAVVTNFGLYLSAKSKEKTVLASINEVYLDAVPGGRLGDVEGILESKLKALGGSEIGAPTNLVFLLSKITEVLAEQESAKLTNFNFNGEQMSLQLTLEVDALSTVADIRSGLTKLGVTSDSPRTTALGDGYQARMRVTEER